MKPMSDGAAAVLMEAAVLVQRGPLAPRTAEQLVGTLRDSTGADHACLVVVRDTAKLEPAVDTDSLTRNLLRLESSLREGPVLDSATTSRAVLCHDLAAEARWPFWAPESMALGISSVLAVPVALSDGGRGALACFAGGLTLSPQMMSDMPVWLRSTLP
jgi:hypothetical protein